ncbi:hypothetical protein [Sphingobium yanoikuyae]|uniref:hypothetical protein n=1 Tax=Sphingobium yanoikuyae TaxID=13690 RepID=UPI00242F0104|nr:hypothetical protein [Sphingobium yanoikuyae]
MQVFLNHLRTHHGVGLQIRVAGPDGVPVTKSADVVSYDEIGITFAVRQAGAQFLEAYPWSAVHGLLTTLNPATLA